jgi:NAD(P)-dependent dehydrogenase (short-subunit alcohol dehydrogenase family)
VVASDRDEKTIASLQSELDAVGPGHTVLALDVTDPVQVQAAASRHDQIDVLFNCAGWVFQGTILETGIDDWRRSFDINVTGMFHMMKAFLPAMIARGGGSIVNVASVASNLKGVINRAAYMSSKAAVIGLSKSVAIDFMAKGIRVNTICPGTVDSPSLHDRARALGEEAKVMQTFVARQPIGRLATPDEIAALAIFLASDESAYATGADFIMDGGITL